MGKGTNKVDGRKGSEVILRNRKRNKSIEKVRVRVRIRYRDRWEQGGK